MVYDGVEPYLINANIISRPSMLALPETTRKVSLLTEFGVIPEIKQLEETLLHHGYYPEYYTIDQSLPANQDIISTLDLAEPFFYNISSKKFANYQQLIASIRENRILWLTQSSQIACKNPGFGMVLGLARTLRGETSIDFNTLEIDRLGPTAWESVVAVFEKIQRRYLQPMQSTMDPDYEFVLSNDTVQIGRYHAVKLPHRLPVSENPDGPKSLRVGKRGMLQSLRWEQQAALPELQQDELEVESCYVGLNFKVDYKLDRLSMLVIITEGKQDVLTAIGLIGTSSGDGFGLESSIVVRKVGTGVQGFRPGDRVMLFGGGSFTTRMHVSSSVCVKIPDGVSDEDAATMPAVYSTVIHSLMELGNVQKGKVKHRSDLIGTLLLIRRSDGSHPFSLRRGGFGSDSALQVSRGFC